MTTNSEETAHSSDGTAAAAGTNDALVARAYGERARQIDALTRLEWLAATSNFARVSAATRAAPQNERFARALQEATSARRDAPLTLRDHAFAQLLFLEHEAIALAARAAGIHQPAQGGQGRSAIDHLAALAFDRRHLVCGDWSAIKHPDVVLRARELLCE